MPMKKEIDLEEDVGFYEQTLFSQVSEEADNLENADVQETSAHEAEHVEPDVYVNEKEAYEAYRKYGYNLGFSVRKDHHSYWPNSRNLKSKDFVCSKAGFKKLHDLNIQRKYQRSDTRTGCPAMIRFTVDEGGYWKVKKFIENLNHDLPRPEDRHLLRSCKNMCDEKQSEGRNIASI
ncbi:protein FAR1-RELATED SEQUENCE 6-like [Dendrobium catenatum]|uniref:protein FAR1-RELATED SEQUENCE 6-like n=1 Tax=Dendrobium catenatum TaxID=906689 RepID=UPI0009F1B45A|nr:protein FAR1-RELATED SEQUENCE 6-like [Dendrobium catenatum]